MEPHPAPTVMMAYDVLVRVFNGESFADFKQDIEALQRSRPGLTDEQRKDLVLRHIGHDVRRACQPEQETTRGPLSVLGKVYRDRGTLSTLAAEFYHCSQGAYESTRHFSYRLNQALKGGYTREGAGTPPDLLLRDQFSAGLRNEGLRLHLVQHRLSNPEATFLDVREFALKLSNEDKEEDMPNLALVRAQRNAPSPAPSQDGMQEVLEQLRSLSKRMERLEQSNRGRGYSNTNRQGGDRRPVKCYRCQQSGHIARDCTAHAQVPTPTQPGNAHPQ